ncbi:MAG TPA: rhomboid family intramembrane serine protease [Acidisarcina sp.]|nr:rhomboid family intramembrane serine protease [Acidisarcina sp.]
MPRTAGIMTFPEFRGFTRKLILWNLGVFFFLLVLGLVARGAAATIVGYTALVPAMVAHGAIWQLVTYSFLHQGLLNTALEMLSLWFLGSFLEQFHGSRWMGELYFISVIGSGVTAVALSFALAPSMGFAGVAIMGSFGGLFGLLIAFGVLHGDMEFMLFPLPVQIKAKYLVTVYLLIAFASFFLSDRIYALAQLGGALCGFLYVKTAPRRGIFSGASDRYFDLRNSYYKWKRRRAARKFEVYMRKQNREVHFDQEGRYIDPDRNQNPKDKRWMN